MRPCPPEPGSAVCRPSPLIHRISSCSPSPVCLLASIHFRSSGACLLLHRIIKPASPHPARHLLIVMDRLPALGVVLTQLKPQALTANGTPLFLVSITSIILPPCSHSLPHPSLHHPSCRPFAVHHHGHPWSGRTPIPSTPADQHASLYPSQSHYNASAICASTDRIYFEQMGHRRIESI